MTPKTRFIPQNSTEIKDDQSESVVYTYTNGRGQICAVGYGGKRTKPDFCYAYTSEERRTVAIQTYFNGQRERAKWIADRKATRKNAVHNFQVGDILNYSFGYDMTINVFYQVVGVKGKSIQVRELKKSTNGGEYGYQSEGRAVAVPNEYASEEVLTKIPHIGYKGEFYVTFGNHSADKWDGRSCYENHMD